MNELNATYHFALISSFFAGIATFQVMRPLAFDLFDKDRLEPEALSRQQLRHRRLRETSTVFRVFEKWVRGVARCLERRFPWLLRVRTPETALGRLGDWGARVLFGNPKRMGDAVQVRATEQPWLLSELMGAAMVVSTLATVTAVIALYRSVGGLMLFLVSAAVFLFVYKLWMRSFMKKSEEKQRAVLQFLPHAVDTLSMVMQSGGTFLAGIESILADFPKHELSKELLNMRNRLTRGQSMKEAIGMTSKAICLPEFDDVARILLRIHDHGAPSSESFIRLSKQMRLAHLRRMEEQVGQAESKIALPTMLVLFSCMLICLAPFIFAFTESNLFD